MKELADFVRVHAAVHHHFDACTAERRGAVVITHGAAVVNCYILMITAIAIAVNGNAVNITSFRSAAVLALKSLHVSLLCLCMLASQSV